MSVRIRIGLGLVLISSACGDPAPSLADGSGGSAAEGSDGTPSDGGGPGGPITTGMAPHCDGASLHGGDDSGDGILGMDDDMPLEALTAEIRRGEIGAWYWVGLRDLVVTTAPVPHENSAGWDVYVQDPDGGPWSGLRVWLPDHPGDAIAIGDSVDVVGVVGLLGEEYYVTVARPDDELTPLGTAAIPEPPVLTSEQLQPSHEVGRSYEGTPVRVESVMVTHDDLCDGEFVLDNVARVDDRFAPGQITPPSIGTTLGAVGGVLIFAGDAYEIAPRDLSELDGM